MLKIFKINKIQGVARCSNGAILLKPLGSVVGPVRHRRLVKMVKGTRIVHPEVTVYETNTEYVPIKCWWYINFMCI